MTPAEIDTFLAETRHAVMGTNRLDGSPQLSPVWYLYRSGKLYTSVFSSSAKCRNLKRDPRVTVCVDGDYPDARAVTIYGTVTITEERSSWRDEIEQAISERYHETAEEAGHYLRETAGPPSALVIVTPQRVLSHNYN
jgi:PPOX class probable F420-dependent enzyme